TILGTADYLSPEQAKDSHEVDIRADIYGLGATFYFLLTGNTLFGEGTVAQKLLWHQVRQPRGLNQFRNDVPSVLDSILMKMLAKDPKDRYQTPGDVAETLMPFCTSYVPPPSDSEMPKLSVAASGGIRENAEPVAKPISPLTFAK